MAMPPSTRTATDIRNPERRYAAMVRPSLDSSQERYAAAARIPPGRDLLNGAYLPRGPHMSEFDVQKLLRRDRRPDLGNLEADIWRREAWFAARARASRLLTAWQSALIACAVIASGTVGFTLTV